MRNYYFTLKLKIKNRIVNHTRKMDQTKYFRVVLRLPTSHQLKSQ